MKSSEKKKRKRTEVSPLMRLASLCSSVLNNPDKPRVCCFFLLRQEENRTEITHLKVDETMADGQGKGECLYSVVLNILCCETAPLRPVVWQLIYFLCVSDLRGILCP